MLGTRIARHSILMVLRNFGPFLRIAAPAMGGFVLFQWALWHFLGIERNATGADIGARWAAAWLAILVAPIPCVISGLWSVVSWHRYVLLEEPPSALSFPERADRMLAYFGRTILLVVVLGVLVFGVFVLLMLTGAVVWFPTPDDAMLSEYAQDLLLGTVVSLGLAAAVYIGLARFYPMLPAAAVGQPIGLRAAWRATSGKNWACLLSGLCVSLLLLAAIFPAGLALAVAPPLLAIPLSAPFCALALFIYVSYMTALYECCVEKRACLGGVKEPSYHFLTVAWLGYRIARRAVLMVFCNLGPFARIAGPAFAGWLALHWIAWFGYGVDLGFLGHTGGQDVVYRDHSASLRTVIIINVVAIILIFWSVVGWHRYLLLAESASANLREVPPDRILAYFLWGLLYWAVFAGVVVAVDLGLRLVGGILAGAFAGRSGTLSPDLQIMAVPVYLTLYLAASLAVVGRLSPMLPAAAIGKPLGLLATLRSTSGATWTCLVSGFLVMLVAIALRLPILASRDWLPPVPSIVVGVAFDTLASFILVSYATTMYGHFVERRDLT
ncbi:MAG: hypothetical protein AAGH83_01095 [Pseudomonadota bacterium]